MGWFGGSTSRSTSNTQNYSAVAQAGAEGDGNLVAGGDVTTNFDDNIAATVNKALDIVGASAVAFDKQATNSNDALATLATAQKSPELNWLPYAGLAAAVAIAALIWGTSR